jgi:prepilin-type processing-associated H-X9-DG protein
MDGPREPRGLANDPGSGGGRREGARSDFSNSDSWHPGGVNVTMADGSVRFVKNSMNIQTWLSLGTRANGEVISADSY